MTKGQRYKQFMERRTLQLHGRARALLMDDLTISGALGKIMANTRGNGISEFAELLPPGPAFLDLTFRDQLTGEARPVRILNPQKLPGDPS